MFHRRNEVPAETFVGQMLTGPQGDEPLWPVSVPAQWLWASPSRRSAWRWSWGRHGGRSETEHWIFILTAGEHVLLDLTVLSSPTKHTQKHTPPLTLSWIVCVTAETRD